MLALSPRVSTVSVPSLTLVLALSGAACNKTSAVAAGADGGSGEATNAAAPASASATPLAGATLSMLTSGFEGEIDGFTQKAGGPQKPIALLLKGDKLRFEIPEEVASHGRQFLGEKAWGLYDTAAKKLTAVSDARKQAVVIDLNGGKPLSFGPPGHAPGSPSASPSGPPSKIVKTGRYETVAGTRCEDWDITSDHKEGTLCVAEHGVSWLSFPSSILPSERAWMSELVDGKHFPLKFVGYEKDGTEDSRVEVTKIDKKALDDSEFQVPAGYNVLDLEKMFAGGMPGMPAGMMPPGMPGMPPGAFSGRMGHSGPR